MARVRGMDRAEQKRIVEALVLASPEPLSAARLAQIVPDCTPAAAKDLVNELNTEFQDSDRAFEIWEVAGGYQVRTRAEFSGYLQQLQKQRPLRLSRAALETLSIVSYKQPATRSEIEQVRGVDAGAVLKSLMERDLVKIVGQREVPGRPMLYGTTRRFLEVFGLPSLKQLPTLREVDELMAEAGVSDESDDEVALGGSAPTTDSHEEVAAPPQDHAQAGDSVDSLDLDDPEEDEVDDEYEDGDEVEPDPFA